MQDPNRGTGRTTKQIKEAPLRALFIAPTHHAVNYTKRLARSLGREDLEILSPSVLQNAAERLHGRTIDALIYDHALYECLHKAERKNYFVARAWLDVIVGRDAHIKRGITVEPKR